MNENNDATKYKYIYPLNTREQKQLDIMMDLEGRDIDPLDSSQIGKEQQILFQTDYWYVTENRFPYEGAERQFMIAALGPVYNISDMSPEMWADLLEVWKHLVTEYQMDGGAFCFRYGDPARSGASLKRLHAHLIMPKTDEKVRFGVGGKTKLKEGLVIKEKPWA